MAFTPQRPRTPLSPGLNGNYSSIPLWRPLIACILPEQPDELIIRLVNMISTHLSIPYDSSLGIVALAIIVGMFSVPTALPTDPAERAAVIALYRRSRRGEGQSIVPRSSVVPQSMIVLQSSRWGNQEDSKENSPEALLLHIGAALLSQSPPHYSPTRLSPSPNRRTTPECNIPTIDTLNHPSTDGPDKFHSDAVTLLNVIANHVDFLISSYPEQRQIGYRALDIPDNAARVKFTLVNLEEWALSNNGHLRMTPNGVIFYGADMLDSPFPHELDEDDEPNEASTEADKLNGIVLILLSIWYRSDHDHTIKSIIPLYPPRELFYICVLLHEGACLAFENTPFFRLLPSNLQHLEDMAKELREMSSLAEDEFGTEFGTDGFEDVWVYWFAFLDELDRRKRTHFGAFRLVPR